MSRKQIRLADRPVSQASQRLTWLVFGVTSVAIVTGTVVTGAGPHAGDENAERLDIAIPTAARLHAEAPRQLRLADLAARAQLAADDGLAQRAEQPLREGRRGIVRQGRQWLRQRGHQAFA